MLGALAGGSQSAAVSTILILGGYGGFGGRLSRRLAAKGYNILVAGRDIGRARRFCSNITGAVPVQADRNTPLITLLERLRPTLVIDAAGPFQGSSYHVPEACIVAAIPYLDLADGRTFVIGIGQLDAAARQAGVAVIAGASSVPALSGAVVRHLCAGMQEASAIEIAISASNRAAAGQSVAEAILSYVGKPLRLWRGKRWTEGHGWQSLQRITLSMSNTPSLGRRWAALADVPDLELLPARIAGNPAVTFRAGTELSHQNLLLWLASWPVRWGWLGSLRPFARLLRPLQHLTAGLGSDRSGMLVRAFGFRGAQRLERRWTLIADEGTGPEIPTLAAALLAERIIEGGVTPGAHDAGTLLDLDDFAGSFGAMAVRAETSEHPQSDALYMRVMGPRFAALGPVVARMHNVLRDGGAHGRATVACGGNVLTRIVASLMRFPGPGEHELHVSFEEHDGSETWTRDFSGKRFSSHLSQSGAYLVERFGPLRFRFDLLNDGNGLRMIMRGWSCAGLPLPLSLAPRSEAREWQEEDRFHFDVPIALPFVGPVVHYRGWLSLDQTPTE